MIEKVLDEKGLAHYDSKSKTYINNTINTKINTLKGANNGLAELDGNGKIPSGQLPSYVDDVIEGYYYISNNIGKFYKESTHITVITGETGKIYIDLHTNKTYRWSGSAYVVISETLALGETSSTAYRGDRGKTAYEHSQSAHAPSNAEKNQNAFSNVAIGSTVIAADSTTDTLTLAGSNVTITPDTTNDKVTIGITKANVTSALGYTPPTTNTTYSEVTTSSDGLMSSEDKAKLDGITESADSVSFTQSLTSGTEIGTIKINGTNTKLYAPSNTDTTYNAAGTELGLVKSGGDVTITDGVITVKNDSHNHTIAHIDGLQDELNNISEVANEAKNIEIGGRNLIKGTNTEERKFTYPESGVSDNMYYSTIDIPNEDNYVLSFDAKSTVNGDIMSSYFYEPNTTRIAESSTGDKRYDVDGKCYVVLSDSWTRYWIKYTQDGAATTKQKHLLICRLTAGEGSGEVSIRSVKLEKGNVPTDWSPAPEDIEKSINDIQIGGRNLLPHTDIEKYGIGYFYGYSNGSSPKGNIIVDTDITYDGHPTLRITPSSDEQGEIVASSGANAEFDNSVVLNANETYTYSCMIYSNVNDYFNSNSLGHFQAYSYSDHTAHNCIIIHESETIPANTWTKVKITFKTTKECVFRSFFIWFEKISQVINVCDIKLEKGNKATDWSPAPGDIQEAIDSKAESNHSHAISNIDGLQDELNTKVPTTRKVNGKALSADITLSANDIGADTSGSANTALTNAKSYADTKVNSEVTARNSAISAHNTSTSAHNDIRGLITGLTNRLNALADSDDTTLDQMSEIVAYIKANKSLIDSITTSKVNVTDIINNLTTNVTNKPLSAAQGVVIKSLIDTLQTEVNGKAKASDLTSHTGNTTVHITSTERTNWNDANSKKHTHSNKTVLDNTTASFTTEEKNKLAGITAGANSYTLPAAGTSLGGVKSGGHVTISSGVITVNDDSHNHVISNIDGLQDELDNISEVANKAKNIQIGGRNLATGTSTEWTPITLGQYYISVLVLDVAELCEKYGLKDGDTLTYSVQLKTNSGKTIAARWQKYNSESDRKGSVSTEHIINGEGISTVQIAVDTSYTSIQLAITNVSTSITNTTTEYYRCIKLEKGDKATDWTPSPDDIQEAIDDLQTSLDGKAPSSHGRHIPSTCTTITDWNNATITGWYMASNAANAPKTGVWYMGHVVAHNENYVFQEIYEFAVSTDAKAIPKHIRAKNNGVWGNWTTVTVAKAVPSDAKFTDTVYTHPNSHPASMITGLATVATSGKYSDLSGTPTIPTKTSQLTNDSGFKTTDTTYSKATSSALGLVKIGYTASGKNYPVQLNNSGQMYVNVPWTDNNTTYNAMTAATSSAAGKAGLVPAPAAGKQTSFLRGDGTWVVPTDTKYTHPTTSGNKHIPSGGSAGQILRWSADGTAVWGNDNNTTYSNFVKSGSGAKAGLVPAPSTTAGTTKYLREDGTWTVPPNTTYSNMTAATSSAAGKAGLVPAPSAGAQGKFLRGDGTWQTPTNTTYSVATASKDGLMSAADKDILDNVPNNYLSLLGGKLTLEGLKNLTFYRSGTNVYVGHTYEHDGGILGAIAMNSVNGGIKRVSADFKSFYTVIDTGNMASHVISKSGGTMTGTLNVTRVNPVTALTNNLGTSANPFLALFVDTIALRGDTSGQTYGGLEVNKPGTADTVGLSRLMLGNSVNSGTAGNASGSIIMYGTNTKKTTINPSNTSADITLTLPNKTGTLALSDKVAPISHASAETTYGAATSAYYGHVKLTDVYGTSTGTASSGVGASAKAVYDAYSYLNSKKIQYMHLNPVSDDEITGWAIPTTEKTYTTYQSRKFSDYEVLMFVCMAGGYVRNSITIPRKVFDQQKVEVMYVDSANAQRYVDFTLVSDTSFKVKGSSNTATGATFGIYGFHFAKK